MELNEAPRQAVIREVKEELDLKLNKFKLICLDYKFARAGRCENIQLIFYGGVLSTKIIKQIKVIGQQELSEFKFCSKNNALKLLNVNIARRLPHCLRAIKQKKFIYLENGQIIFRGI